MLDLSLDGLAGLPRNSFGIKKDIIFRLFHSDQYLNPDF